MATDLAQISVSVDTRGLKKGQSEMERFGRTGTQTEKKVNRATDGMNSSFMSLKNTIGVVGTALAALGAQRLFSGVMRSFSEFERGLVGVGKTTDITGAELEALGGRIQGVSREVPIATGRLMELAQAAGQLGVRGSENITRFAKTLGQMELATDVVGEEGARSLARLLTVTGESMSEVDRLGSAITELGNSFAATEQEIVQTSTFLAPATQQYGLAASEVAGLSAALRALGQRAETSGSAIGAALAEIDTALAKGNEGLRTLVELTGQSATELEKAFRDNATGVLLDFGEALNQLPTAQQTAVLEQFNLAGRETRRVIGALASNTDLARKALEASGDEWERNMALTEEAAKAATTFSAQVQLMANAADEAAVEIGRMIAPSALSGIHGMRDAAIALSENMDTVTDIAAGLAAVVGGRLAGSFAASTKAFAGKTAAAIKDTQATYQQAQATKVSAAAEIEFLRVNQASLSAQLASAQGTARSAALRSQLAGNTAALTAATRSYNAALATTNVTARVATGAMGALRGVVGLFGGAVGLAVTAAYLFRDSLFDLVTAARSAEDGLFGVIDAMNKMDQTIRERELSKAISQYEEDLQDLADARKQLQENARLQGSAFEEATAAIDEETQATKGYLALTRNLLAIEKAGTRQIELKTVATEEAAEATDTLNKSAGELSETFTDEVIPAVEEAIEGYVSLREKYDPIFKANRELSRDLKALHEAWNSEIGMTEEEYNSLYTNIINDNLKIETSTRDIAPAIQELGSEVNHLENIWENTTRNIQSAMSDMFYDILDQGKVTFDGILDAFKRMAAEMMAQRIMLSFGGGGSLFSSAASAGQGGGGMGQLFGGGGALNLQSLMQGGGALSGINATLGGFGRGAIQMGAEGLAGMGFRNTAASWTQAGTGAMNSLSGLPGGLAGGTLITAGAGWAGGQAGNAIGEGLLGKEAESNIGQGLGGIGGAAVGMSSAAMGATFGSWAGPIGAAIGAAIGAIVDVALGGDGKKRATLGVTTTANTPILDRKGYSGDRTTTESGLGLTAYAKRVGDEGMEAANQMVAMFDTIDSGLISFLERFGAGDLGGVLSGRMLPGKSPEAGEEGRAFFGAAAFNEINPEDVKNAAGKFVVEWLDAVEEEVGEKFPVADIFRHFEGSGEEVVELLSSFEQLFAIMDRNPLDKAISDFEQQQDPTTLFETYNKQARSVRDLVNSYDGSISATQQLSQALATQQDLAYNLALVYQQASASVESLFGNLHEQIRTSLMSQEELYNYQRRQVHTLTDMLADMTDPERIMQTSERIENLVSSMWQPLGEEQRQRKGPQFLEYLEEVEQVAQERLQVGMDKIESNQNDINESIRQGINNAATVMQQAAQGQQEAANRNIEAANMMGMSAEQIAAAVAQLQRSGGMEANG